MLVQVNDSRRAAFEAFSAQQLHLSPTLASIKGTDLLPLTTRAPVYLPAPYMLLPAGIPLAAVVNTDYYPLL